MTQLFLSVHRAKIESFSISIIAKADNKQNASKLLQYKQYFKLILKMILKSFDF